MPAAARTNRLDFRLSRENRRLIERAAAIRGQPLTAFALSSLLSSAEEVIEQDKQRRLSDRDRRRFLQALEAGRPNATLARAARQFLDEQKRRGR